MRREPLEDATSETRAAQLTKWWAVLAAVAILWALAIWLTSPRFEIDGPSLVDDWAAIEFSPDHVADVLRFENPEQQRFRPGWIVWNYLQWHTLDAPDGLVGPNGWNLLRALVIVAGLTLLTALALPRPHRPSQAALQACLASLPALLMLAVPKFSRDVARFGVQEPLLLGGMTLGGALLVLAARQLLDPGPVPRGRLAALALSGSALWVLGAYQKEASLSAVPLLAAALVVGRDRLRGLEALSSGRRVALGALGLVVVLPLLHVAIESVRIVGRGDLVYDAQVDAGRGIVEGFEILYDWSREVFSENARRVLVVAVALTVLVSIVRRRVDVLAVAALASGALTLVFAAQTGVAVSRYYLPVYALAAMAIVLSLSRLSTLLQVGGLVLLGGLALTSLGDARSEVRSWTGEERAGTALVDAVADAEATGCPVAVANVDLETGLALPVLVALEDRSAGAGCGRVAAYLVFRPGGEGDVLARACAPGSLERVHESFIADVYACARLRSQPIRHPTLGRVDAERMIERYRLGGAAP